MVDCRYELQLEHFVYYLCFFIIGALLVSDERFGRAIRRDWWLALIVGVAAFLGPGGLVATWAQIKPAANESPAPVVSTALTRKPGE